VAAMTFKPDDLTILNTCGNGDADILAVDSKRLLVSSKGVNKIQV
jgi:hypothetical protein